MYFSLISLFCLKLAFFFFNHSTQLNVSSFVTAYASLYAILDA